MPFIKARDGTDLYVNDWGSGSPVVLIHGWPLNGAMWSDQALFLAEHGYRVVTYDRRGFGRSGQPWDGYDYDTLAGDLSSVMETLDLRGASLVGFSMGGGEVARYLARHGTGRIAKTALIAAVTPYLLKGEDNQDGVPKAQFDGMIEALRTDRPKFLSVFGHMFFGVALLDKKVSDEVLQWSSQMALMASLRATVECVKSFGMTDFRRDMAAFTVPTLIVHGTGDKTVPIDVSGRASAKMIPGARLVEYDGEPHGLFATAKDRLNADLLAFLRG